MRAAAATLPRRLARAAAAALCAAGLAACAAQPAPPPAAAPAPAAPPVATVDPSAPVMIALLAPRSAAESDLQAAAADFEAAARLAAQDAPAPGLALRVYDTAGEPTRAAQAAQAAVDDGAALIVGPAFSDTTSAARAAAETAGVTVLSFSSDSAAGGAPVWVLGDLPENEADRIVGYAAARGLRTLNLVRPDTAYGALSARAVAEAATRHGVARAGDLVYQRSFQGVEAATAATAPALAAGPSDSVLIADTGGALDAVASFLDFYDLSPRDRRYLGLGGWRSAETLTSVSLRNGWFAGPDPDAAAAFQARFRDAYGRAPHPIARFAFDGVAAAAQMLADGAGDPTPFDVAAVTRARGFQGAAGWFVLTPDGANRRPLAVFSVGDAGFETLDPAPASPALGF